MILVERESIEPVYVAVTDSAGDVVAPSKVALVAFATRPEVADWINPTSDGGRYCYPLDGEQAAGDYWLFARVTDSPWDAVLFVDTVQIR